MELSLDMINEQVITEAYFGKNDKILAIEKQIGVIRSKYGNDIYFQNINYSKEVETLKRQFEELFGFDPCVIEIIRKKDIDLFTLPVNAFYNRIVSKDDIEKTKDGIRFKKSCGYGLYINIYSGLLFNNNFTDAEIVSFLLHEVGHNFADVMNKKTNIVNQASKVYSVFGALIDICQFMKTDGKKGLNPTSVTIGQLLRFDPILKTVHNIDKYIQNNSPIIATICNIYTGVANILYDVKLGLISFVDKITLGINKLPTNIISQAIGLTKSPFHFFGDKILGILKYSNERFADNFATLYGYGPELAVAIAKLQDNKSIQMGDIKVYDNKDSATCNILNNIYAMNTCVANLVFTAFDPHPTTIQRLDDQLKYLEKEIKTKDIDPKLAKVLQGQIKQIKDAEDTFTNTKKSIIEDPQYAYCVWNAFILKTCKGDIKHNIFGKDTYDVINKGIENAKEVKESTDISDILND